MPLLHELNDRIVFFTLGLVNFIVGIIALNFAILRNNQQIKAVDIVKLGSIRLRRPRHARQLRVQTEIILNGDRRQRLRFFVDFNAFLGFDSLMQPVRPAAAGHGAAGIFIENDDFRIA